MSSNTTTKRNQLSVRPKKYTSNELRKEGENKENVVPEQMESVAVLKKQLEAVKDVLTTRQKFEKDAADAFNKIETLQLKLKQERSQKEELLVQMSKVEEDARKLTICQKEIQDLKKQLSAVTGEKKELENQVAQLVGHQNVKQRLYYVTKLHEKIARLEEELDKERGRKLRIAQSTSRLPNRSTSTPTDTRLIAAKLQFNTPDMEQR